MTYEDQLQKLAKASRRLSKTHKAQGRNNSRDAVLEALRALRKALDRDYPRARKKPRPRRSLKTRHAELRSKGYMRLRECANHVLVEVEAEALGVRIIGKMRSSFDAWVPAWLGEACTHPPVSFEELRELKRSPAARTVFMTQRRLERSAMCDRG